MLGRVLDVRVEIPERDWDALRHQSWTHDDLRDIYTWFRAKVTVDGESHTNVGVRKKGFRGTHDPDRPSLKVRFDKYVDGQLLGGVIKRMTLNNNRGDRSRIKTCMTYLVFTAAGTPAPRCNFATVTVNGQYLGVYANVEPIKKPFLSLHFDSKEGNLYEGAGSNNTLSDFTPELRVTLEKETNENADDWTDVDAVIEALQDPTDAGLEALGEIVDLDRFLTFWAAEVLTGHWDGYTGYRNNYHFYREPDGPFVFIPWGTDLTFHIKDDPTPHDDIDNPPPSVLAVAAIPNRLYNHPEWRDRYVTRLKELIDTIWNEEQLLTAVDTMAAIVQQHETPNAKATAAKDTHTIRFFILKRKKRNPNRSNPPTTRLANTQPTRTRPTRTQLTLSDLTEVLRHLEIAKSTWYRWRQTYAGMTARDAKRLKKLEAENTRGEEAAA